MMLLPLHKIEGTFSDRTLHSTLVEVPLCTKVAMGLAIGCPSGGTYCQCYFVSTAGAYFVEEAVVVHIAATEALALRAHVPVGEGFLLLVVALLELLFLVQSASA
jgi:hypothetical protein